MPFQKNFALSTDDDNVWVLGPFHGGPIIGASESESFFTPDATPVASWPMERTGYVSRVYGITEGGTTTSSANGPTIDITAKAKAGDTGSPVEVVDIDATTGPYFDSGELASGTLPFTGADYLTGIWTTAGSWTGTGTPSLTMWIEVTVPSV